MNLLDPVKWGAQAAFTVTSTAVKIGMNAVRTAELLLGRDGHDDAEQRFRPTTTSVQDRDRETPGSATLPRRPPVSGSPRIPRGARSSNAVAPPTPESRFQRADPEPELVEAEGAADPGATLRVGAPWDGYDDMRANDIAKRVRSGDDATKAVVRLYEQAHKKRKSVLAATE